MAIGDAAAAAGLTVWASTQAHNLGYQNDNQRGDDIAAEIAARTAADTAEASTRAAADTANDAAIAANAAAIAAAALGFTPVQQGGGAGQSTNKLYIGWTGSQLALQVDSTNEGAIRLTSDGQFSGTPIYTPYGRANPVSTSYVAAYLNSDGRLGATPSARRFKQDINPTTYSLEQINKIQLVTYRIRAAVKELGDQAQTHVGVIAEQLVKAGLSEFVSFTDDGKPFSVHYEQLALVCIGAIQEAAARLNSVEARLAKLEGTNR